MGAPFQIRPARSEDLPRLMELERACYADPWSESGMAVSLVPPGFGLVGETPRGIAGFLVARELGGSGEILNLAVAPGARRRGLALALVRGALEAFRSRGAGEIFLEVRESNVPARHLYGRVGFRVVGMRRGYYRSPPEDALIMRRDSDLSA